MAIRKGTLVIRRFSSLPLVIILLLAACSDEQGTPMSTYPQTPTFEQLANLRYQTVFGKGGSVQLRQGSRRMRTAFGSNRIYATIQLAETYATGDLDGDGVPDAAAVLVSSPGGVGTFLELQTVINQPGGLRQAASAYLTELAQVSSVKIEAGEIKVTLLSKGGAAVERRYRFEDSSLVELP